MMKIKWNQDKCHFWAEYFKFCVIYNQPKSFYLSLRHTSEVCIAVSKPKAKHITLALSYPVRTHSKTHTGPQSAILTHFCFFPSFFSVCMLKDCTVTSSFVPPLPSLSSALFLLLHFKKTSGSHSVENQNNMREREIEKGGETNKGKNLLVKIKQYEKDQHIKTRLDLCQCLLTIVFSEWHRPGDRDG